MRLRWAVAALCLLSTMAVAQPLFQPLDDPHGQAQLIGVVGMARYRTVTVDVSRLARFVPDGIEPSREITLNLFEDTVVRARLQRFAPSPAGGWLWVGALAEPEGGQVVIAFDRHTLAGMVEVNGRVLQIRNAGGPLHVIRELPPGPGAQLAALMASPAGGSTAELDVFQLTNQERQARGLYPYAWNDLLADAARAHSQDMGTRNFFSHTNPDGKTPGDRIRDAGYNWSYCGENIAAGQTTAAEVVQGWMNSPGHRANILSTDFCDLGVGYAYVTGSAYGHYWTQNFGKLQGVASCPAPGGNTPPTVSLGYTPSSPTTADTMDFTAHASDPDGDPLSYQWYVDGSLFPTPSTQDGLLWVNPPAGPHTVRVVVSDGRGGVAEDSVSFTVQAAGGGGSSHTYGSVAGWYMISVPANEALPSGLVAWSWNPATHAYERATTLAALWGYWVRLPADFRLSVSGSPLAVNIGVDLAVSGWHQVSAPWPYPKSAIRLVRGGVEKAWSEAVAAGWVRDSIYGYRATDGAYTMPTTLDPWYGYWLRALVDDLTLRFLYGLRVTSAPPASPLLGPAATPTEPPPPPSGEGDLPPAWGVEVAPNPVREVHTATFQVVGPMSALVEGLWVRVFDLAGQLVWEGSAMGAGLVWHTESLSGEFLANGVYLYQAQVKVAGEWLAVGLGKLAIYR